MLSIIISSYQTQYYNQLVKNISETIGHSFQYEIIPIWNPNLMSITQAYNLGAQRAQYDYFLFLHEDVIFYTKDWGKKLVQHLSILDTGVIGIAGSNYVPKAPSGWFIGDNDNTFIYIMGTPTSTSKKVLLKNSCPNYRNSAYGIDGVFMAVTRKVFLEFYFNENLQGFHSYDIDFSLKVAGRYNNYVINDILIEHFSFGKPDVKWLENNIEVRKNIKTSFSQKNNSAIEKSVYISFIEIYFKYHSINLKEIKNILEFYPLWRLRFKDHIIVLKRIIQYVFYKRQLNLNRHSF